MRYRSFKSERKNFGGQKLTECELARKTLFEFVMAVIDFGFALRVFVVAVFFGKRLFKVADAVK